MPNMFFSTTTTMMLAVLSAFALPFESVITTNGLAYSRTREYYHGGLVFPNSDLGMNKFSERSASEEEIVEAIYELVRFLKYIHPRQMLNGCDSKREEWNRKGFERMKSIGRFPSLPDRDTRFKGNALKDLRVVVFPFKVDNKLSEGDLEMLLLKIYSSEDFQGACYYNKNTSDIGLSFVGASGNANLVGQEAMAPYLTVDERLVQGELYRDLQKRIRPSRRHVVRPITHGITNIMNEIEVQGSGL